MSNNFKYIPKLGEELTLAFPLIDNYTERLHEAGKKVIVREVNFWTDTDTNYMVIKVYRIFGHYHSSMFKELRDE